MLQSFRFSQEVSVSTHCCGHTLNLVVYWEEDALHRSVSVCHSLSSDHLPVMCSMDMSKLEPRLVLQTVRNLRAIYKQRVRQDDALLSVVQLDITAHPLTTQRWDVLSTLMLPPPSVR